jgi:uncharacterized metal-binding protein YceD (DUF177 family)
MKREDLLDLNDVLQHPGRKLAVDVSTELPEEEDIDLLKPLEGFIEAVSTGNLLLLTGEFNTRAVIECARCGGPLEVDVKFELEEQFPVVGTPSSFGSQDYARVEITDEPYTLFEGNNLMVEALLREGLIVNMPMQTLCEYGWEGPCPIALERGQSRPQPSGRPEFEKLSNLLDPEDDKS